MGSSVTRCICCTSCRRFACETKDSSNDTQAVILHGQNPEPLETKKYSWDTRAKINVEDYKVDNLKSSEMVKRGGEINGEQFIISNCSNSKIYLLDFTSTVTIDDCSDCLFVLGPSQGSIFLRDTKNSTLVCTSSQLRLRDCENIHLFVGCESDPIIEASSQVLVAPYFLSYNGIHAHFQSAKLSKFRATKWSEIYDFTPNDLRPNWSRYCPEKHEPQRYICPPQPHSLYSDLNFSVMESLSFIPVTHHFDPEVNFGKPWRKQQVTFTLEPGQQLHILEQFMNKFYEGNFVVKSPQQPPGPILTNIDSIRTQFIFTYYSTSPISKSYPSHH